MPRDRPSRRASRSQAAPSTSLMRAWTPALSSSRHPSPLAAMTTKKPSQRKSSAVNT
ncbi:hypothetical protein MBAV_006001 [Candidatus Magnetobacterium bavaricum]|uniref:Uncharacterized protein n=1 Tax=Candidatus Magnetobacterium bavaricum TaxID=29290 RepID=A0A0F3GIV2_9BACT|nr:hypothetical protein MBAV_006001 [Candidatus Magnetobacterium bavaricum]